MCNIIHGKKLFPSSDYMKEQAVQNPDGIGAIFSDGKKLRVYRRLFYDPADYDRLASLAVKSKFYALHFRLSTQGGLAKGNVHPFSLGFNRYLMHNGMIKDCIPLYLATPKLHTEQIEDYSDTAILSEYLYGKPLQHIYNVLYLLGDKFLLITPEGVKEFGIFHTNSQGFRESHKAPTVNWLYRKDFDIP